MSSTNADTFVYEWDYIVDRWDTLSAIEFLEQKLRTSTFKCEWD